MSRGAAEAQALPMNAQGAVEGVVLPVAEIVPAVPTQPAIPPPDPTDLPEPSPFLRLWRAVGGVGALLVAWAAAIIIYLLAANASTLLARFELAPARVIVAGLGVLAVLWLAVAFLSCALAGAYCLLLAITHRRW